MTAVGAGAGAGVGNFGGHDLAHDVTLGAHRHTDAETLQLLQFGQYDSSNFLHS